MTAVAMLRIRLCESDRDSYGGPEWVVLDTEALLDLPASELEQIEQATDSYVSALVGYVENTDAKRARVMPARIRRVSAWLARRQAKLVDEFDKFDPKVLRADYELVAGDAVPPAAVSEPSSVDGPSDAT